MGCEDRESEKSNRISDKSCKIHSADVRCRDPIVFAVRAIGQAYYRRTPKGGINESGFVEINGTKQWIGIYGEDRNNPVLLYLHGGPGTSTSLYDYAFTRQWADIYTVVTWDQRNCGKSYSSEQNDIALTYELLMSDGIQMTE